jgi:hypothetical protein
MVSIIGWKQGGKSCKQFTTVPTTSVLSDICSIAPRKKLFSGALSSLWMNFKQASIPWSGVMEGTSHSR